MKKDVKELFNEIKASIPEDKVDDKIIEEFVKPSFHLSHEILQTIITSEAIDKDSDEWVKILLSGLAKATGTVLCTLDTWYTKKSNTFYNIYVEEILPLSHMLVCEELNEIKPKD